MGGGGGLLVFEVKTSGAGVTIEYISNHDYKKKKKSFQYKIIFSRVKYKINPLNFFKFLFSHLTLFLFISVL